MRSSLPRESCSKIYQVSSSGNVAVSLTIEADVFPVLRVYPLPLIMRSFFRLVNPLVSWMLNFRHECLLSSIAIIVSSSIFCKEALLDCVAFKMGLWMVAHCGDYGIPLV